LVFHALRQSRGGGEGEGPWENGKPHPQIGRLPLQREHHAAATVEQGTARREIIVGREEIHNGEKWELKKTKSSPQLSIL